jgi:protein O-mannosyl-transferase
MAKKNIPTRPIRPAQPKPAPTTATAKTPSDGTARRWWLGALFVLVVTAACFAPTVSYKFVNWDDDPNIVENPNLEVLDGQSMRNIFTLDKGAVIGNYNPLPIFTFFWEKRFVQSLNNPNIELHNVIHFNNVVLHLATVLFVMLLLRSMGFGAGGVIVGGLLFGIHPMRVESVAWATERKDVLFAVFFFAALYLYTRYLKRGETGQSRLGLYLGIVVLALLSHFSKVQAVTLVLSMLLLDYWFRRPFTVQSLIVEKLPFWAMSLAFGLINVYTLKAQGSINDDTVTNFSFLDRLCIGAYSYLYYWYKLIFPYPMSPLYPYPKKLPFEMLIAPLPFIAFWAGVWYFLWKKDNRIGVFGILFFFFNVMFLLQVLGAGQGLKADRFTYVAYFGAFAIVAWLYDKYSQQTSLKQPLQIGLAVLFLIYAVWTINQSKIWKDGGALWGHVMKFESNTSSLPYWNRGQFFRDDKKYDLALADFNKGISIDPNNVELRNSRGKTYFDMASGNVIPNRTQEFVQKAMEDYTTGISSTRTVKPKTKAEMLINRGALNGLQGNLQQALQDINDGLAIDPKNKNGFFNRSLVYFNIAQRQPDQASAITYFDKTIEDYTRYLDFDPNNANIWYERGMLRRSLNRNQEAMTDLARAVKLMPNFALAYLELARAQAQSGNKAAAQQSYARAQQLGEKLSALDTKLMNQ